MSTELDEVPKLPRGRGLKFSKPELFRIVLTLITLVGVIMLTGPCANAVSGFVTGMDGSGSNAPSKQMPKPGNVVEPKAPQHLEQLSPNMTEEELKALIERSKQRERERNAGSNMGSNAGSGSAAGNNAGSGSAAP